MHPGSPTSTLSRPECQKDWWHNQRLLLITPRKHEGTLGALLEAYQESKVKFDVLHYEDIIPHESAITNACGDMNSVLFVVPGNRAPGTVVSAPYIFSEGNKKVPVGILPAKSKVLLQQFALAAHKAHTREKYKPVLALLSQRHPRYLRVSERMESIVQSNSSHLPVFKWSADVVLKEDMLKGLNYGLGVAVYVGHGRPAGWVGYYGTRSHHFDEYILHPLGCMLSLCCHTASRRKTGLSFSEAIVLKGMAASALGAVTKTKYTDNTKWAVNIIENLMNGIPAIGELILRALPQNENAASSYRLIGDPLAPVFAPEQSIALANTIKIYS